MKYAPFLRWVGPQKKTASFSNLLPSLSTFSLPLTNVSVINRALHVVPSLSWSLWRNEIRSTSYCLLCLNCDECWQTFSQGKCIGSVSNDRLEKAVRLAR